MVKLSSKSAITTLNMFFKKDILDTDALFTSKSKEKKFIFLEISPHDLSKNGYELVKDRF